MLKFFTKNSNTASRQKGQTLIETLVAAFILVMGISAALGLANYSLSATTGIRYQTVALGLAREGIEVVKNMRDTNWLKGTLSNDCHDFLAGSTSTAYCYRDWLSVSGGYTIPVANNLVLNYTPSASLPWSLSTGNYALNISTSSTGVFYNPSSSTTGNSGFYRRIIIESDNSFSPFNQDVGPRLKVTSQVWWIDKNCDARTSIPIGTTSPCSVSLSTYLTNWRNF